MLAVGKCSSRESKILLLLQKNSAGFKEGGGKKWGNATGEAIALILQGIGVPRGLWKTLGRSEREQGGKRTRWDGDGNDLLERWLSGEWRGCCGEEPAFPVRRVSAAAQLVPFPRSV